MLRPGTAETATVVDEAARALGTDEAAEIPVPAGADEEERLVLDTIAADVVAVGAAAQTLKGA